MDEAHDESISKLLRHDRTVRVIGFDDAPFERTSNSPVPIAGVVCADDRFEGMVWDEVTVDGDDATDVVGRRVASSKFVEQLHALFLDGIAVAGFNVVDVAALSSRLGLPVVTVMRRRPDWQAIEAALDNVEDGKSRLAIMRRAGPVQRGDDVFFQSRGLSAAVAVDLLRRTTRKGHIPEPIRLAHLITRAVVTGESGRRA